jgi:hypothetical protein
VPRPLHPALEPPEPIEWIGEPDPMTPEERERFMREYLSYPRDGLKACTNPLCSRPVKTDVTYCCHVCAKAHEDRWEIGERGVDHPALCHTDGCEERTTTRNAAAGLTPGRTRA